MLAALMAVALLRDRPSDVGLPAYGETQITPPPATTGSFGALLLLPLTTLRDISKSLTFWVLFATFFVCGASTNGLVQTHFIALCGDFGLPRRRGQRAGDDGGVRSGRYHRLGLAVGPLRQSLAAVLVLRPARPVADLSAVRDVQHLRAVAVRDVLRPRLARHRAADREAHGGRHFGRERANIVFGWIFAGHQLGAASIAYGAGFTRTVFDTYLPAFFVSGALCLIAAALVLTLAKPRRQPALQPAE